MAVIHAKPKQWFLDRDGDQSEILKKASHGDLVIASDGDLRSLGVKFVLGLAADGSPCKKKLIQKDETGSGYCDVPVEITMHFDDPVSRYLPVLSLKAPDGAQVLEEDWNAIQLDAERHQKLLQAQTGGKEVATGRQVLYFVGNPEYKQGYYIYNPDSPDKDSDTDWKKLDSKIAAKYLAAEPYRKTEKDFAKGHGKKRELYEKKFLTYLQNNVGGLVTLRNIPTDVNTMENEGSTSATGTLQGVGSSTKGGLPDVKISYTEYVEDRKKDEIVPVKRDLTFSPETLADTGALGGIHFWVERTSGLMLDPPIWKLEKI